MSSHALYPLFCAPFVAVLLSLAIFPTFWPKFWKKYHFMILSIFGIPALLLAFSFNPHWVIKAFTDYASFILLLGTLYKIGGGLYVSGAPKANPLTNLAYMGAGAVLGNLIGTLGASMLLIRPLLRSNRGRKHEKHIVVFFIFIVSNCGGLLTPLGDPPLLYGYLQGVPFFWSFKLFPIWFFIITALVGIFATLDSYFYLNDPDFRGPSPASTKEPFKILGRWNLFLAVLTIVSMVGPQMLPLPTEMWRLFLRMFLLLVILQLSESLTPKQIKVLNNFSWEPFHEVVSVFAAIFATMILTQKYLESMAPHFSQMISPWLLFWVTGGLSAFLDNAPAYASMLSLASSLPAGFPSVVMANKMEINQIYLMAISTASVIFGAGTYIGNGPNLIVKTVAEREGVKTPSFFAYIGWAIVFIVPVAFLTGILFFI